MRCRDSRPSNSRDRMVSNSSRVDSQDSRVSQVKDRDKARVHHRAVHRLADSSQAAVSREETLRVEINSSRETILSSRMITTMAA